MGSERRGAEAEQLGVHLSHRATTGFLLLFHCLSPQGPRTAGQNPVLGSSRPGHQRAPSIRAEPWAKRF